MPDQGPAPLLNRAWARRGWAAPPHWGRSVPGLMAETTVTFGRRSLTANNIGGFGGSGFAPKWTGPAHVELVEDSRPANAEAGISVGAAIYRHYDIYVDLTPGFDPALVPVKGDLVTFSDGLVQHSIPVDHVTLDAGLADHIQVHTDEWQA